MTAPSSAAWTLSGFGDEIDADPAVQLAVLAALGARHIEVRSAWGVNIVELADDRLAALRGIVLERGFGVSAIASPIGKVDVHADPEAELARLGAAIRAAHALDSRYIRIFSFYRGETETAASVRDLVLGQLAALAREAERAGVILLHENEKNIYGDTPERVRDIVESVGSPALRLAWDPANFVQVGVSHPFDDGFAMLRPYVDYLQIKDAVHSTGAVVPAGLGDGQVEQTVVALRDAGYAGFVSLEPHLALAEELGGFSGPAAFGVAARALASILERAGIPTV